MQKGKAEIPWWLGKVDDNIWDTWHKGHEALCPSEDLARFLSKLPEGSRVLDVGCGSGINCYYMSAIGLRPYGIDGSANAIALAEQNVDFYNLDITIDQPPVFFHSDITKQLPFTTGQFDAAIDICSIQHLENKQAMALMKELKRVLKLGGKLFSKMASTYTTFRSDVQFSPPEFRTMGNITHLFQDFKILEINQVSRTVQDGDKIIAHWLVEAES